MYDEEFVLLIQILLPGQFQQWQIYGNRCSKDHSQEIGDIFAWNVNTYYLLQINVFFLNVVYWNLAQHAKH